MGSARTVPLVVVSTGCASGIGPEVAVVAASRRRRAPVVLVGDLGAMLEAAALVGVAEHRLMPFDGHALGAGAIAVVQAGPPLPPSARKPGRPSRGAGAGQLAAIEAAYRLVKRHPGSVLVTGPVSKRAIAMSGVPGANRFTGHTEWLERLDRARSSVMCFAGGGLATSLVTTHVALASVPPLITPARVTEATLALVRLLRALGKKRPRIAVASLNPHGGEGEMFGAEERRSIAPGIARAKKRAGGARISGPIGAETAYRKAHAGEYDGVVAMYHDQATIPMKLLAFGEAVNVTMGLSIVRTSVDHGTAYDIAWKGVADPRGMVAAIDLAERLRQRPAR
jgi:4-hydroxythreonine-4-phosphate dehydrogenase